MCILVKAQPSTQSTGPRLTIGGGEEEEEIAGNSRIIGGGEEEEEEKEEIPPPTHTHSSFAAEQAR